MKGRELVRESPASLLLLLLLFLFSSPAAGTKKSRRGRSKSRKRNTTQICRFPTRDGAVEGMRNLILKSDSNDFDDRQLFPSRSFLQNWVRPPGFPLSCGF